MGDHGFIAQPFHLPIVTLGTSFTHTHFPMLARCIIWYQYNLRDKQAHCATHWSSVHGLAASAGVWLESLELEISTTLWPVQHWEVLYYHQLPYLMYFASISSLLRWCHRCCLSAGDVRLWLVVVPQPQVSSLTDWTNNEGRCRATVCGGFTKITPDTVSGIAYDISSFFCHQKVSNVRLAVWLSVYCFGYEKSVWFESGQCWMLIVLAFVICCWWLSQ